ncbi:CPS1 [Candida theae]|uniref:CPS1 n=1 Tax=Candida theae TaxID=1198502 RepID=A0AAD5BBV5_9ASCO|nr:CPS1 [Candida theae]KAI5953020.1 CPS1 [Candida theae]
MIGLPLDGDSTNKRRKYSIIGGLTFVILLVVFFSTNLFNYLKIALTPIPGPDSNVCPLQDPIAPASYYKDNSSVLNILYDSTYRKESIQRLSGAVQVDTQIFDNQPDVDEDPEVWAKFKKFHKYLQTTFPLVYENLDVTTVNTYGLVYTWKGSKKSLKPVLLTAHQDTVPVQKDSLDQWTYPPFEGHYDGEYIYGRGVSDCKNVLIAILETLELLLKQGYNPSRTVIAAFGFDEEASGVRGASAIGKYLEEKLGKDSIYAVVDEGPGLTTDPFTNTVIATPGTGEKGYIDIHVELATPGGHSSIPPDHTSIGIVSELGYLIEKDPYDPILTNKNPIFEYFQCVAVHDPKNKIPKSFKKIILRSGFDKFANSKLVAKISESKLLKYLIKTSQALDIINGGEKVNALPEDTKLAVNHRVAIESNVATVKRHFTERVVEVAKRHGLIVTAFGKTVYEPPKDTPYAGEFKITGNKGLEAAPLTPTDDTVWKYLSGVTRHVFEDLVYTNLTYPIATAPAIMSGNTDTRYYWNLTRNIFRYSPFYVYNILVGSGVHSVDERLKFDGHLQLHAWFYEYLQAIDTAKANN